MDIKSVLSEKSADYLSELVIKLLDGLKEQQRLDFIGKYIDAQIVLKSLAENSEHSDRDDIVRQVEDFCMGCLDGAYYVDADYNDYYDAYDEDAYRNSEWADRFAEYIRLAVLYARSGDCFAAYEILIRTFDCIRHCEQDFDLLGTYDPLAYLDVDIEDAFDMYFFATQEVKEDIFEAYNKMFTVWSHFECYCEPLLHKYITDLNTATEIVIHKIKNIKDFSKSEKVFLMLEKLFIQRNESFDKLKISKRLLSSHDNFGYYAALGCFEQDQWENAIGLARDYLEKTTGSTKIRFRSLLTDCYEKNDQLREAYDNSLSMFYEYKSYELYKRTRSLAEKLDGVGADLFFGLQKTIYQRIGAAT